MQNYAHFHSLGRQEELLELLEKFPSYFFLFDEQGYLACWETGPALLGRLPNLCENSQQIQDIAKNLQLFAFVCDSAQVRTVSELKLATQTQIALCFYGDFAAHASFFEAQESLKTYHFRELLPHCHPWEQSLLARGKELSFFDREFVYCNICSTILHQLKDQYAKACSKCQNVVFPRQDPSVISLITWQKSDSEWLLLARNYRFRQYMYSLIAGFVDCGEDLEQALCREAWEEAAVSLTQIEYLCSQAWPNMHSLMAGFTARSQSPPLKSRPDGREIESLLWLERRDVRSYLEAADERVVYSVQRDCQMPHWYIPAAANSAESSEELFFSLPEKGTISRKLIEQWAQRR